MKPTDDLYQLIKSLSPSEKRYFKVFAKRHVVGDVNKYESLFDAYDDQPDDEPYDEDRLKKTLGPKKVGKNFADDKKSLHETVMKALRTYHAGVSVDNQLNELLTDEELYRAKRLNGLRRKAIEKGIELAEKHERYYALLTLLDRESTMNLELNQDNLKDQAKLIGKSKRDLLDKIGIISKIRETNDWFFIHYRIYAGKMTDDFWREAEERISHPVLRDYQIGHGFSADLNYHKTMALYYQLKGDSTSQVRHYHAIYDLFETQYPHQKQSNTLGYRIAMYNYISALFSDRNWERMKEMLDFAATLTPGNDDEAGEDFQNLAFFRQLYFMNTSQFDRALDMTDEINAGLKKHKKKVNKAREIAIKNNLSICHMIMGNWEEAVDYTELVIMDKSEARQDLKHIARLHQLIARFELEQYEQLMYQIRNTQRWIESKDAMTPGYANTLKLLNTLIKNGGAQYFKELRKGFDEKMPDYDGYDTVKTWLRSRVRGISMEESLLLDR